MIIEKMDFLENLFDVPCWKELSSSVFSFWKKGVLHDDQQYLLSYGTEHKSITVNVESYTPKQRISAQYESHICMADIQIVLQGDEYIDVFPLTGNEKQTFFDTDRDLIFYADKPKICNSVHLYPGMFVFIFPGEAHMPCIRGQSKTVCKMVVKVPISLLKKEKNDR